MAEKVALLIDGGFIKKKLQHANHRFPTVADIVTFVTTTFAKPQLAGVSLFRVYFYDAPP